jgi:excisionase family DNA binding protein
VTALDDLAGRLTCTVEEAGEALSIGRSAAYAAARRGEIPTLRLGRTLRVPVPRLLELVGAHAHSEAGVPTPTIAPIRTLSQGQEPGDQHDLPPTG